MSLTKLINYRITNKIYSHNSILNKHTQSNSINKVYNCSNFNQNGKFCQIHKRNKSEVCKDSNDACEFCMALGELIKHHCNKPTELADEKVSLERSNAFCNLEDFRQNIDENSQ